MKIPELDWWVSVARSRALGNAARGFVIYDFNSTVFHPPPVMGGLEPPIQRVTCARRKLDGRVEPAHDGDFGVSGYKL